MGGVDNTLQILRDRQAPERAYIRSTRVAGRDEPLAGLGARTDQTQDLTRDFSKLALPCTEAEHRPVNPNVLASSRLAEYVCPLQMLEGPGRTAVTFGRCRLLQFTGHVGPDPCSKVSHLVALRLQLQA